MKKTVTSGKKFTFFHSQLPYHCIIRAPESIFHDLVISNVIKTRKEDNFEILLAKASFYKPVYVFPSVADSYVGSDYSFSLQTQFLAKWANES